MSRTTQEGWKSAKKCHLLFEWQQRHLLTFVECLDHILILSYELGCRL